MADPAINAAAPLFAVNKLDLLLEDYGELLKGAEEDVRSLRDELEMIDKVVQGLTRTPQDPKPVVKEWLYQVSELSNDTQKVVDKFLKEQTPKNLRFCLLSNVSVLHRPYLKLASDMVNLKAFAIEVSERCLRYKVVPAAIFTSVGSDNMAFQPEHVQPVLGSQMPPTAEDFTEPVSENSTLMIVTQPAIGQGVLDLSLKAVGIALRSTMSKLDELGKRNQMLGMKRDIHKELTKMNEIIPALICKPQELDPIALAWLNQVSELSGNIQNAMDKIIQEVAGNNSSCLLPIVNVLHRPHLKLATEMLKLRNRAVEVNERCTRYNLAPISFEPISGSEVLPCIELVSLDRIQPFQLADVQSIDGTVTEGATSTSTGVELSTICEINTVDPLEIGHSKKDSDDASVMNKTVHKEVDENYISSTSAQGDTHASNDNVEGNSIDPAVINDSEIAYIDPKNIEDTEHKIQVVLNLNADNEAKKRKALRVAAGFPGVISASLEGGKKMVVTGEDVDAIELTAALRRRLGHADIVSVTTGKKKKAPAAAAPTPAYIPIPYQYPSHYPTVQDYHPQQQADPTCSIM